MSSKVKWTTLGLFHLEIGKIIGDLFVLKGFRQFIHYFDKLWGSRIHWFTHWSIRWILGMHKKCFCNIYFILDIWNRLNKTLLDKWSAKVITAQNGCALGWFREWDRDKSEKRSKEKRKGNYSRKGIYNLCIILYVLY